MNFQFDKRMDVSDYRRKSNFRESLSPMQKSYIVGWIDLSLGSWQRRAVLNRVTEFVFSKMHGIPKVADRMQLHVKDIAPCS